MKRDLFTLDLFGFEAPPIVEAAPELDPDEEILDLGPRSEAEQPALFGSEELPIPEIEKAFGTLYVHFETAVDIIAFAEAIGQPVTTQTHIIAFPEGALPRHLR